MFRHHSALNLSSFDDDGFFERKSKAEHFWFPDMNNTVASLRRSRQEMDTMSEDLGRLYSGSISRPITPSVPSYRATTPAEKFDNYPSKPYPEYSQFSTSQFSRKPERSVDSVIEEFQSLLSDKLDAAYRENDSLKRSNDELHANLENRNRELSLALPKCRALEDDLNSANDYIETLAAKVDRLEDERCHKQANYEIQADEIRSSKQRIDNLQDEKRRRDLDIQELEWKLENASKENRNLSVENGELEADSQEVKDINLALRNECEDLVENLSRLHKDTDRLRSELRASNLSLVDSCAKLNQTTAERDALRRELEEIRALAYTEISIPARPSSSHNVQTPKSTESLTFDKGAQTDNFSHKFGYQSQLPNHSSWNEFDARHNETQRLLASKEKSEQEASILREAYQELQQEMRGIKESLKAFQEEHSRESYRKDSLTERLQMEVDSLRSKLAHTEPELGFKAAPPQPLVSSTTNRRTGISQQPFTDINSHNYYTESWQGGPSSPLTVKPIASRQLASAPAVITSLDESWPITGDNRKKQDTTVRTHNYSDGIHRVSGSQREQKPKLTTAISKPQTDNRQLKEKGHQMEERLSSDNNSTLTSLRDGNISDSLSSMRYPINQEIGEIRTQLFESKELLRKQEELISVLEKSVPYPTPVTKTRAHDGAEIHSGLIKGLREDVARLTRNLEARESVIRDLSDQTEQVVDTSRRSSGAIQALSTEIIGLRSNRDADLESSHDLRTNVENLTGDWDQWTRQTTEHMSKQFDINCTRISSMESKLEALLDKHPSSTTGRGSMQGSSTLSRSLVELDQSEGDSNLSHPIRRPHSVTPLSSVHTDQRPERPNKSATVTGNSDRRLVNSSTVVSSLDSGYTTGSSLPGQRPYLASPKEKDAKKCSRKKSAEVREELYQLSEGEEGGNSPIHHQSEKTLDFFLGKEGAQSSITEISLTRHLPTGGRPQKVMNSEVLCSSLDRQPMSSGVLDPDSSQIPPFDGNNPTQIGLRSSSNPSLKLQGSDIRKSGSQRVRRRARTASLSNTTSSDDATNDKFFQQKRRPRRPKFSSKSHSDLQEYAPHQGQIATHSSLESRAASTNSLPVSFSLEELTNQTMNGNAFTNVRPNKEQLTKIELGKTHHEDTQQQSRNEKQEKRTEVDQLSASSDSSITNVNNVKASRLLDLSKSAFHYQNAKAMDDATVDSNIQRTAGALSKPLEGLQPRPFNEDLDDKSLPDSRGILSVRVSDGELAQPSEKVDGISRHLTLSYKQPSSVKTDNIEGKTESIELSTRDPLQIDNFSEKSSKSSISIANDNSNKVKSISGTVELHSATSTQDTQSNVKLPSTKNAANSQLLADSPSDLSAETSQRRTLNSQEGSVDPIYSINELTSLDQSVSIAPNKVTSDQVDEQLDDRYDSKLSDPSHRRFSDNSDSEMADLAQWKNARSRINHQKASDRKNDRNEAPSVDTDILFKRDEPNTDDKFDSDSSLPEYSLSERSGRRVSFNSQVDHIPVTRGDYYDSENSPSSNSDGDERDKQFDKEIDKHSSSSDNALGVDKIREEVLEEGSVSSRDMQSMYQIPKSGIKSEIDENGKKIQMNRDDESFRGNSKEPLDGVSDADFELDKNRRRISVSTDANSSMEEKGRQSRDLDEEVEVGDPVNSLDDSNKNVDGDNNETKMYAKNDGKVHRRRLNELRSNEDFEGGQNIHDEHDIAEDNPGTTLMSDDKPSRNKSRHRRSFESNDDEFEKDKNEKRKNLTEHDITKEEMNKHHSYTESDDDSKEDVKDVRRRSANVTKGNFSNNSSIEFQVDEDRGGLSVKLDSKDFRNPNRESHSIVSDEDFEVDENGSRTLVVGNVKGHHSFRSENNENKREKLSDDNSPNEKNRDRYSTNSDEDSLPDTNVTVGNKRSRDLDISTNPEEELTVDGGKTSGKHFTKHPTALHGGHHSYMSIDEHIKDHHNIDSDDDLHSAKNIRNTKTTTRVEGSGDQNDLSITLGDKMKGDESQTEISVNWDDKRLLKEDHTTDSDNDLTVGANGSKISGKRIEKLPSDRHGGHHSSRSNNEFEVCDNEKKKHDIKIAERNRDHHYTDSDDQNHRRTSYMSGVERSGDKEDLRSISGDNLIIDNTQIKICVNREDNALIRDEHSTSSSVGDFEVDENGVKLSSKRVGKHPTDETHHSSRSLDEFEVNVDQGKMHDDNIAKETNYDSSGSNDDSNTNGKNHSVMHDGKVPDDVLNRYFSSDDEFEVDENSRKISRSHDSLVGEKKNKDQHSYCSDDDTNPEINSRTTSAHTVRKSKADRESFSSNSEDTFKVEHKTGTKISVDSNDRDLISSSNNDLDVGENRINSSEKRNGKNSRGTHREQDSSGSNREYHVVEIEEGTFLSQDDKVEKGNTGSNDNLEVGGNETSTKAKLRCHQSSSSNDEFEADDNGKRIPLKSHAKEKFGKQPNINSNDELVVEDNERKVLLENDGKLHSTVSDDQLVIDENRVKISDTQDRIKRDDQSGHHNATSNDSFQLDQNGKRISFKLVAQSPKDMQIGNFNRVEVDEEEIKTTLKEHRVTKRKEGVRYSSTDSNDDCEIDEKGGATIFVKPDRKNSEDISSTEENKKKIASTKQSGYPISKSQDQFDMKKHSDKISKEKQKKPHDKTGSDNEAVTSEDESTNSSKYSRSHPGVNSDDRFEIDESRRQFSSKNRPLNKHGVDPNTGLNEKFEIDEGEDSFFVNPDHPKPSVKQHEFPKLEEYVTNQVSNSSGQPTDINSTTRSQNEDFKVMQRSSVPIVFASADSEFSTSSNSSSEKGYTVKGSFEDREDPRKPFQFYEGKCDTIKRGAGHSPTTANKNGTIQTSGPPPIFSVLSPTQSLQNMDSGIFDLSTQLETSDNLKTDNSAEVQQINEGEVVLPVFSNRESGLRGILTETGGASKAVAKDLRVRFQCTSYNPRQETKAAQELRFFGLNNSKEDHISEESSYSASDIEDNANLVDPIDQIDRLPVAVSTSPVTISQLDKAEEESTSGEYRPVVPERKKRNLSSPSTSPIAFGHLAPVNIDMSDVFESTIVQPPSNFMRREDIAYSLGDLESVPEDLVAEMEENLPEDIEHAFQSSAGRPRRRLPYVGERGVGESTAAYVGGDRFCEESLMDNWIEEEDTQSSSDDDGWRRPGDGEVDADRPTIPVPPRKRRSDNRKSDAKLFGTTVEPPPAMDLFLPQHQNHLDPLTEEFSDEYDSPLESSMQRSSLLRSRRGLDLSFDLESSFETLYDPGVTPRRHPALNDEDNQSLLNDSASSNAGDTSSCNSATPLDLVTNSDDQWDPTSGSSRSSSPTYGPPLGFDPRESVHNDLSPWINQSAVSYGNFDSFSSGNQSSTSPLPTGVGTTSAIATNDSELLNNSLNLGYQMIHRADDSELSTAL